MVSALSFRRPEADEKGKKLARSRIRGDIASGRMFNSFYIHRELI